MVTDDTKDDWWLKLNGSMSPQPELVEEFARVVGLEYSQVTSKDFLELSQAALGLGSGRQAVDETAEVAQASERVGMSIDEYAKRYSRILKNLPEETRLAFLTRLAADGPAVRHSLGIGSPRIDPSVLKIMLDDEEVGPVKAHLRWDLARRLAEDGDADAANPAGDD
jgi:hypothetical protein